MISTKCMYEAEEESPMILWSLISVYVNSKKIKKEMVI